MEIALVLVGRAPEFMVLAAFLLEVRTALVWETFRLGLFSTELVVYQVISFLFFSLLLLSGGLLYNQQRKSALSVAQFILS